MSLDSIYRRMFERRPRVFTLRARLAFGSTVARLPESMSTVVRARVQGSYLVIEGQQKIEFPTLHGTIDALKVNGMAIYFPNSEDVVQVVGTLDVDHVLGIGDTFTIMINAPIVVEFNEGVDVQELFK